ncbi:DUF6087 family protein [Streptomyces sparsogenes]|uniref:DUF6087 family protein n=1 Tax=Streptomyces sparsogenes TaxID=67365 RepID=UPI0033D4EFF4
MRASTAPPRRWGKSYLSSPAGGGATHVRPDEPRVLESWDGFACMPEGTALNLAAAQRWADGQPMPDT